MEPEVRYGTSLLFGVIVFLVANVDQIRSSPSHTIANRVISNINIHVFILITG